MNLRGLAGCMTRSTDRRWESPPGRRLTVVTGAVLGIALLLLPAGLTEPAAQPHSSTSGVVALTTPVSETVSVGAGAGTVASSFWGTNVRVYSSVGSVDSGRFNQTVDKWVRWPGGLTGERLNITANLIYNDDHSTFSPPQSISSFVSWCETLGCHAIIELPTEINSPSTAKYYVRYIEQTLGFYPAYWDLGNEPAAWAHFNISWANWKIGDHVNATPAAYAHVANQYANAIHSVDSSARIIGLAGVGRGSSGEQAWLWNVVKYAGKNLSALSVHTYPAGVGTSPPSTAAFFASLNGAGSLPSKIPGDQAAILSGCPSCSGLALFSDETGSGTEPGNYSALLRSQSQAVYMMAETIQALSLNLPNVDYFSYQSTDNSSWFNGSALSNMRPVFQLYSYFFNNTTVGKTYNTTLSLSAPTLLSVLEQNATTPTSESLLVANINTTTAYSVTLGTGFPSTGSIVEYYWDSTTTHPVVTYLNGSSPSAITLSAGSVLELVWSTNPVLTNQFQLGCSFSTPSSGTYEPISGGTKTFVTPNIGAGTGGLTVSAAGSTTAGHELAGQWIAVECLKPSALPGATGNTKIDVTMNYLYQATVTLTTVCHSGGTAQALANASVEAFAGGASNSRFGTTQSSLYSWSETCQSNVTVPRITGSITTGWVTFSTSTWLDFHFLLWAGVGGVGFPNGNYGSSIDASRFTLTSIAFEYHT